MPSGLREGTAGKIHVVVHAGFSTWSVSERVPEICNDSVCICFYSIVPSKPEPARGAGWEAGPVRFSRVCLPGRFPEISAIYQAQDSSK